MTAPDTTKAPEAVGHECPANHDAYARMGFGACPYCCTSLEGIRAAFASPGALSPLPLEGGEALREKVARAVAAELIRQDYCEDEIDPFPSGELTWRYIDQGEVDFGKIADRILATLSALQLTPPKDPA